MKKFILPSFLLIFALLFLAFNVKAQTSCEEKAAVECNQKSIECGGKCNNQTCFSKCLSPCSDPIIEACRRGSNSSSESTPITKQKQHGKTITCEEAQKIIFEPGCEYAAIGTDLGDGYEDMWCSSDPEYFYKRCEDASCGFWWDDPTYSYQSKKGELAGYLVLDPVKDPNSRSIKDDLCSDSWESTDKKQQTGQKGIGNYIRELFGLNKSKPTEKPKAESQKSSAEAVNDWIKNTFSDVDFEKMEEKLEAERLYGRTPEITEQIIKEAQTKWDAMFKEPKTDKDYTPYRLDILNGEASVKYPGENEWRDLKTGDKIPPGSTLFTGADTTTVLSIKDKGVVEILPFTEITVSEEGLERAAGEGKTDTSIKLRKGEIEVNVERGPYRATMQVQTPSLAVAVRGTHFWVSFIQDKNRSTVGVYKGEVEVSVKDGQKASVKPAGDPSTGSGQSKPGVVIVSQKLSPIKLAIAGLVLATIIGGVVLLLKRKFSFKINKKKK